MTTDELHLLVSSNSVNVRLSVESDVNMAADGKSEVITL